MGLFGKKYKCATCGASLDSEAELRNHSQMRIQPAGAASTAFSCSTCGLSFATQNELRQHAQKAHGM